MHPPILSLSLSLSQTDTYMMLSQKWSTQFSLPLAHPTAADVGLAVECLTSRGGGFALHLEINFGFAGAISEMLLSQCLCELLVVCSCRRVLSVTCVQTEHRTDNSCLTNQNIMGAQPGLSYLEFVKNCLFYVYLYAFVCVCVLSECERRVSEVCLNKRERESA